MIIRQSGAGSWAPRCCKRNSVVPTTLPGRAPPRQGGLAGTGRAGTGLAGTGRAGTGRAGTGLAGTGLAGTGRAGRRGERAAIRGRFPGWHRS
jgi:hypothetical protein